MKRPLRALLVEDSADDALMVVRCVQKGEYNLTYEVIQSAEKMDAALKAGPWDIILCDYHMPRFTGFEALGILRKSGLDIPFIIISGTIGEEIAVECMQAGADDYLMKGNLTRLLPAIERGLREAGNRADRKRAEEEIKRAEAKRFELEMELIQSQKLESLGTLASGIAHGFNNILAIISGYSELGERRSSAHHPEMMKCFEAISLASRRGALLVSQLLTFARKTETVFRSLDIRTLIAEVAMFFGETFPKTICIRTDLREDLPLIVGDVTQLHQVFMNLCVNARDAMPGGGTITIAASVVGTDAGLPGFPKASARSYLAIRVTDTGFGMDEATRRKIFDPFFTTKGPSKGTGLGLALVQSIVENHKGMVDVESEPGKGTSFLLYFPVADSVTGDPQPVRASQPEVPRGTGTVLLIEDEVFIIEMVKTVLSESGYTVLVARDGEEGVAMFSRHRNRIAAVLSDFGLPKLRGDEVAGRIKAIDPDAKIILISGFFDPGIRSGMEGIGVFRLLQKPFSFSELTEALKSVLET